MNNSWLQTAALIVAMMATVTAAALKLQASQSSMLLKMTIIHTDINESVLRLQMKQNDILVRVNKKGWSIDQMQIWASALRVETDHYVPDVINNGQKQ